MLQVTHTSSPGVSSSPRHGGVNPGIVHLDCALADLSVVVAACIADGCRWLVKMALIVGCIEC